MKRGFTLSTMGLLTCISLILAGVAWAATSDVVIKNTASDPAVTTSSRTLSILRNETSQNLASGALSNTTAFSEKCRLESVKLHSDAAITQNVTITFVSKTGAAYDTVLAKEPLSADTDFYFSPDNDLILEDGDEIRTQCSNDGSPVANVTASIIAEKLN